ncbi:MAG: hypothetical protein IPI67_11745 [Myxococcales bacterium]|nr:hypothetical protein [Myxococcales bacterium]
MRNSSAGWLGLLLLGALACSGPADAPVAGGPIGTTESSTPTSWFDSSGARVTLPALANQPAEIRAGSASVAFSLVGAPATPLLREDSGFVAAAAGVAYRRVPGGLEDWLTLTQRPSSPVRYRLTLEGVAGLRQIASVLELLDAQGTPRLRVGPAYLVDAMGLRRDVQLELQGCATDDNPLPPWGRPVTPPGSDTCELELRFDDVGLRYPIKVDPPWTVTSNNMAVGRASAEAMRLADGKVLVVAGANSATAELYDPATRSWATTGSMSISRPGAAAALLQNGKVLVTGGAALTSAEVYDPATGKFTATGNMKVARARHTATTLANGKVLIAGGANPFESTACDLYDPTAGTFSSTGALATARADHTATLLNDGRVLLVGTWGAPASELYSPTTNAWTSAPGLGSLEDHTATLLTDGRVLVVGGRSGGGLSTTDSVSIFNPVGSSWSTSTTLPGPISKRRSHGAVRVTDGRVVVVGGVCDDSCAILKNFYDHSDAVFFNTSGNTWTPSSTSMSIPRTAPSVVLLTSGNALVLGDDGFDTSSEELCLTQGCACNVSTECYSGFCVDAVCCDSACSGTCQACTKALKNQGLDGACGDIAADNDPQSECAAAPASSCGLDGMCDGKGACRKHVSGTLCGASSCIDGSSEVHADSCDGSGSCVKNGSGPCKVGYLCKNDACKTACDDKSDCAAGYECLGGSCSLRPNGTPCADAGQCQSGNCVEGVCCDAACDGQCEACKELGKVGTCSPISGDPAAKGKAACGAGEGPCGSTCNGADPKKCVYPGEETKCSEVGTVCDGAGKCVLSGAQCSADGSESVATNGTKTSCGDYRCDPSSGECRSVCSVASDCQLGNICQGKKCVRKSNDAASDDGGCSTSGSSAPCGGSVLGLAFLGGALLLRRRRFASTAVALAALAGLGSLACSSQGQGEDQQYLPQPALEAQSSSGVLDALRARFGARAIERGLATSFTRVDGQLAAQLSDDDASAEGAARVRLPGAADQPLSIEDAASGMSAEVGLEGARPSAVVLADGLAIYPAATVDGDVVLRVTSRGVEDFVSLARRPSAPRISYRVKLHAVAGLRLVAGQLELLDARAAPRLRVTPPYVVDARGARHAAELSIEGCAVDRSPVAPFDRPVTQPGADTCRLVVSWSEALEYPLLVDPTWTTTPGQGGVTDHATSTLKNGSVLLSHFNTSWVWNGSWAASGAMQVARTNATATTLNDGRVLVVGGGNASAELYNPATGTWTATGSMSTSRQGHRAVLLNDGSVLVTGGDATGTAERWLNGTFTSAGSMGKVRTGHTATLLGDGRVLVVGGIGGATDDKSTRLYSLTAGWSAGPNSLELRQNHIAARLSDGRVLIAGGEDKTGPGAIAEAELYNPTGNSFTLATSLPQPTRMAVAVPFGLATKVYVIGGRVGGATTSTWIYDAAGGGWVNGGNMNRARFLHTAELLPSGQILIVGGFTGAETFPPSELQCVNFGCACSSTTPCLVGSCVDGVCCKTACTGPCQACSAAVKGSGANGECGPVADGSDPGNDCATQPASTCGTIGSCNGAGACRLYAAGTECSAGNCSQPTVGVPPSTCNGSGTCVTPPPVSCTAGYACVGTTCKTSCSSTTDCASGFSCKNGECKKKANGDGCADGAECTSGFCVDTVCCDQDCTGQCEACNQTGTPGLCVPVAGAPIGSRPACGGTAPCAGTCSGTDPDACTFPSVSCGDGMACSNGECIQTTAVCVDGDTASQSQSGAKTACSPYRCDPDTGSCRTSCTKASECTLGSVCDQGQCKKGAGGTGGADAGTDGGGGSGGKASPAGDDGGCGCRITGSERRSPTHGVLALFSLVVVLGRRRRGRRAT